MVLHPDEQSECMRPFQTFLTSDDCRTVADDIYQKKALCRIPAAVRVPAAIAHDTINLEI